MTDNLAQTCYAIILLFFVAVSGWAQNGKQYELIPAPDLWYNDVDGIRAGVRVLGQAPGTFGDGPHRLDAGVWFGAWVPRLPVSYYVSFTEPVPSISGFGSEGNVQLISSVRTGFSRHGVAFNKRWQQGFDELNFRRLSLGFTSQKRFDSEYVPYPGLWQEEGLWLGRLSAVLQNENPLGRYYFHIRLVANLFGNADNFVNSTGGFQQLVHLGKDFQFRGRLFVGLSSNETVPEFLFTRSFRPAAGWMEKGLARAKGTIPGPWIESGIFQVAGGANLRGYTQQDIEALNNGLAPLFTSMGSINLELDYPNPLGQALKKVPVVGELLVFRSYLFFDSGTSLGLTGVEETRMLSDAGVGFMLSLGIPDYLGKQRGFEIRYDIPLWLSHPEGDRNFSYRNVIGIGAIISL